MSVLIRLSSIIVELQHNLPFKWRRGYHLLIFFKLVHVCLDRSGFLKNDKLSIWPIIEQWRWLIAVFIPSRLNSLIRREEEKFMIIGGVQSNALKIRWFPNTNYLSILISKFSYISSIREYILLHGIPFSFDPLAWNFLVET